MNATPDTATHTQAQAMQQVQDSGYISALFSRVIKGRVLVAVHLPANEQRYCSTVLLMEQGSLLLDRLFPSRALPELQVGDILHLEARFEGTLLRAELVLEGLECQHGLSFYRASLPESVEYAQRRAGHRVRVDSLGVPIELYPEDGMVSKGILFDISPAGISLVLEDASPFRDSGVYRCVLYPHGEQSLHVRVEVCCPRHDPVLDRYVIGTSFVDLDRRGEHAVSRLVTELERQLLRSRRFPQDTA